MKKVTILAFDTAPATTITAPMDVFQFAGRFFNAATGEATKPLFEVEVVTPDGSPVKCANEISISAHRSMNEVNKTDIILISAVWDIETTLVKQKKAIQWLQDHYKQGVNIAGLCTGSFILAATELLNGKDATTHWGVSDVFMQLYPQVNLKPERLITDAGDLFCSGAFNACTDLALYLVAKFVGYEVAIQSAKALIHDIGRISQAPYTCFNFQKNHKDEAILETQRIIENEFQKTVDIDQLAQQNGMSRRNFERRFKNATGDTPLLYLQRVRVEEAKKILETETKSFDEVCYQVGYEDSSFFRKIFIKHTGLRPAEYRTKFQRTWDFRA